MSLPWSGMIGDHSARRSSSIRRDSAGRPSIGTTAVRTRNGLKIPAGAAGPPQDPDDSWRASAPLGRTAAVSDLEDGGTMVWKREEPLRAGREAELRFQVLGADGRSAPLEPYMGMMSHAVIVRDNRKDDGQVFVHLHPMGTVSMAAQLAFAAKEKEEEGKAVPVTMPAMSSGDTVSFPYEFPKPGHYRLWVQVKTGGKVQTGVFDAEVGNKGAAGP